ncbi:hypothetical protein [Aurantiacibacter aquimixticola]|uniref:PepSY domain-containing protein n=1 Tax=Aurantiacibacter aquimixticola TaxID=1958945 RepID=A0A419RRD2_9SPHN|nr:hypothetical protein [Aurantiacibacter aquimixticola]RJY08314.1 hypothetical protein D6201_02130 [Aurantiacibacter aquimixticola]
MKARFAFLSALALLGATAAPAVLCTSAAAQERSFDRSDRGDQRSAREEMRAGRNMPIRQIERRIIPQMRDDDEYIGFEYDRRAQAYRLKFIRNGRMIWVDVDAQTARVLRISR